jgi:HK97 family phage portal protein
MRHSAVWACLRLRADLISTLPLDVYRKVQLVQGEPPIQVEAPKTPILISPGGERCNIVEWLYSSQVELDRSGNAIGIIREVDGAGFPARIDLQPSAICAIGIKGGELAYYRIDNTEYPPEKIWHERQYTSAGSYVGLSPVMYAAYTIGEFFSVQDFVTSWFTGGAVPRARLRNKEKKLVGPEAAVVKEAWRAAVAMGEPFVHGSDWEYELIQAEQASSDWLDAMRFSHADIARFFGVPSDLIDASVSTKTITYASITERNLQFLIMNLGPAIIRRENALSALLPRPRYVKFNSDAILRMDAKTKAEMIKIRVDGRVLAPSEARALDNLPPFTESQLAEFDALAPAPAPAPAAPADTPAPPEPPQ